jgi:ABC-type sugar transport system ATPase subunit
MTLVLQNISKSFGANQVLRNISAQFEPGTITALVGDNGAGKSTLLKIISGAIKSDSGTIQRNGQETSMVLQDLGLAKQLNVIDNLFIGREEYHPFTRLLSRKNMAEKAKAELAKLDVHVTDLNTPVGKLSGGQQQAIAILRAVMFNPQILLLDEPTAALGTKEVEKSLALIRQQRDLGRTVILVSHRLNDVLAVADRILVLKHGQIAYHHQASATSIAEIVENIVS